MLKKSLAIDKKKEDTKFVYQKKGIKYESEQKDKNSYKICRISGGMVFDLLLIHHAMLGGFI